MAALVDAMQRHIDGVALVMVGESDAARAAVLNWFRGQVIDGLSLEETWRGEEIEARADELCAILAKRVSEIEAKAGRA
jgi:hypothetical protein